MEVGRRRGKTFFFLFFSSSAGKIVSVSPFPVFSFPSFFFQVPRLVPSSPFSSGRPFVAEEEEGGGGRVFFTPLSSTGPFLFFSPPFIFFADSSQKAGLCFPRGYSTPLLLPPPLHSHGKKERSCLCHDFPPSTLLFCAKLVVDD